MIWRALDWIDSGNPGIELLGYWKNQAVLEPGAPDVYGTLYLRREDGRMLLGMLNAARKPVATNVKLDFAKLGFGGAVYAQDANTYLEVPVANGAVPLDFTAEGIRLIKFSAQPFEAFTPEKLSSNLITEATQIDWLPKGVPDGWTTYGGEPLRVVNGAFEMVSNVSTGDGVSYIKWLREAQKGQHYMFECEMRVDCDTDFLNPNPEMGTGLVWLGEHYNNAANSLCSNLPGDHFQRVRLFFTVGDITPLAVRMGIRGKGKLTVRNLEVYQIKNPPPTEWNIQGTGLF